MEKQKKITLTPDEQQVESVLDSLKSNEVLNKNVEFEQEISLLKEDDTSFLKKSWVEKLVYIMALAMALYHIYTTITGVPASMVHRPIHFAFGLVLMFLAYNSKGKRVKKEKLHPLEWVGIALSIGMVAFYLINRRYLMTYMWYMTPATTKSIAITVVVLVLSIIAGRRMVGTIFVCIALFFIAYAWLGPYMPGLLRHRGVALNKFCDTIALIPEGVFGGAMGTSATYIFNFILFGAFLKASKVGNFFIDIAMALAGQYRGGPAKVAIISSGAVGTISGSVVANVLTTGSFTIPLMKKLGYKKEFSAAVEATASTGGMIMPPVMGSTAFLVAELAGVPYAELCKCALLPAVLYYLALLFMIDLEAAKNGLKGISKENLPKAWEVFKKGWFKLLPLVTLIALIMKGYSPLKCGLYGILVTIIVSWFDKETRMGPRKILDALVDGSINSVQVVAACACAGIVVGLVSQTGLGFRMSSALISLAGGSLLLSLIFCMVIGLILGMGLTVTPAYVILAALIAPVLTRLGLLPQQAHLFCFYYACLCGITPPVAIGAFAAAGIADADPMKTGLTSVRLAGSLYIIPFMFAYAPQLILIGTVPEIIQCVITSAIGVYCFSIAVEGWLFKKISIPFRLIVGVASLLCIYPGTLTDLIGLSILSVFIVFSVIKRKHDREKPLTA